MQLTYGAMEPGLEGGLVDTSYVKDVKTLANTATTVDFGHFVTRGATATTAIVPATAAAITSELNVRGVALHDPTVLNQSSGDPHYPLNSPMNVLRKGRVWVRSEDAITVGTSTVNVRYAGTGTKGAFRGAAVTDETAVLPKSKWLTSCDAGGLAVLELDL